jgi:hypothetical protein
MLLTHPSSVSQARKHVARVLVEWECEELIEDARLVISELVTNAIKAAERYEWSGEEEIGMLGMFAKCCGHVWIGLHRVADDVVMEVWDPSRNPPKIGDPDMWQVGGRGLQVVNETVAEWGYRWPKTGGKIVWAFLKLEKILGAGKLEFKAEADGEVAAMAGPAWLEADTWACPKLAPHPTQPD